jgi:hypothetical protein
MGNHVIDAGKEYDLDLCKHTLKGLQSAISSYYVDDRKMRLCVGILIDIAHKAIEWDKDVNGNTMAYRESIVVNMRMANRIWRIREIENGKDSSV